MATTGTAGEFEVEGRRLAVRNLDRVVFPHAGTTKGQLLYCYIRIAEAIAGAADAPAAAVRDLTAARRAREDRSP